MDEVAMDVVPVAFGSGRPFFTGVERPQLLEDPHIVIPGTRVLHLGLKVRGRPCSSLRILDPARDLALWLLVPQLLASIRYCVLATADVEGTPWATPVFFAARGTRELFWASAAASRHSRNIAARPMIGITVFDSTVPIGTAEASTSRPGLQSSTPSATPRDCAF